MTDDPGNSSPLYVIAHLQARLQPMHRGELEDALERALRSRGHQIEVVGGGSALTEFGEIISCDIELELSNASEGLLDDLQRCFRAMLAPKGSHLLIPGEDRRIDLSKHEGLALYLNGTDLPAEVYRDYGADEVYEECDRLLKPIGSIHSHWQGPTETALYMYGEDFAAMRERLSELIVSHPLCQRCRIEQIA